MLATDYGARLLNAYRRAANILKIEEAKDNIRYDGDVDLDTNILREDDERELTDAIGHVGGHLNVNPDGESPGLLKQEDFEKILAEFSHLDEPVNKFFEKVTVNDPEPEIRRNRLRLLAQLRDTMHQIADFSKIEG
jgi:glycyl-tRNA synthetase beta chain